MDAVVETPGYCWSRRVEQGFGPDLRPLSGRPDHQCKLLQANGNGHRFTVNLRGNVFLTVDSTIREQNSLSGVRPSGEALPGEVSIADELIPQESALFRTQRRPLVSRKGTHLFICSGAASPRI